MSTKKTNPKDKSRKLKLRHLLGLLAIVALVAIIVVATVVIMKRDAEPIPLTDLPATYKGEIKDVDGNLLVPFDVAYPEAFASGAYEYREDALLLKMADHFSGKLTRDLQKCGFVSIEPLVETANGKWYEAKVAEGEDIAVVIQRARSLGKVLMADFDYIIKTTDTAVESTEDGGGVEGINEKVQGNVQLKNQWYLQAAGIQEAWTELEKHGIEPGGSSSIVVAVIDTGVDFTHPDLKDNIWVNVNEIPNNGQDDDGNGYVDDYYGYDTVANQGSGMDVHGHGTHVAGIIAATNNKEGVVGIAYNAKIMPITAGQATGVFLQNDIAEAIIYAYEMGADVINMSFGGSACSIAVQDALMTAYSRVTLVAAAGNDSLPNEQTEVYGKPLPGYPGALSYVIGVMSVNQSYIESGFSNWDTKAFNSVEYEVYAPGEGIYSTLAGGGYGNMSGTSMAAPVVSGIAALLRSYYTDRDMYPSKFIQAQLCATSEVEAICVDPKNHVVSHKVHNLDGQEYSGVERNYSTGVMVVDAYTALTVLPKPDVNLYDYYIFDGVELSDQNNGDGIVDAGETIDIAIVLRNRWGMSKDTTVSINARSELFVPDPYVEILISTEHYDSVGTYSTKSMLVYNEENFIVGYDKPLRVKISEDCPNDYIIGLNVEITCGNGLDAEDETLYANDTEKGISFGVRSGVILPSQITEDMTLTSQNLYIIPNAMYIHKGVTVTVEPGTRIQFWTDDPQDVYANTAITCLTVEGNFICQGSEEEPIELFPSDLRSHYRVEITTVGDGYASLSYTTVTNPYLTIDSADHCTFRQNFVDALYYRYLDGATVMNMTGPAMIVAEAVTNSVVYKCGSANEYVSMELCGIFDTCVFVDSNIGPYRYVDNMSSGLQYNNCAFVGNYATDGSKIGTSTIKGESEYIPFAETIVRNSETGTTYIVLAYNKGNAYGYRYMSHAKKFAQYIGGDLLYIETREEWEFLANAMLKGSIDWKYGETMWGNGTPVADFLLDMSINESDTNDGYLIFSGGDLYTYRAWTHGVILEIPDDTILLEENFGQADIDALVAEWIDEGYNTAGFTGNAILNNFQDTNVEHWLRIVAQDRVINENYMKSIGLAGNWWGTTNEELIGLQILDFDDYQSLADINFKNYLTTAPENTFPFVTAAYLLNSAGERTDRVSNETVTFVVEFNRDMDTTVPLRVRFGSSEPYAEYEITGEYVSARRWEGTYTLKTTIENGRQRISIENGRAADDHYLQLFETDSCRFGFEIDTTGAQAMMMQATATAIGIELSWVQDDFDTLAGYNVYRSTSEDGYYQRLNEFVIPADVHNFFDDTVEPGVMYYYNFTVVKTDFTESTPSGKINLMSLDTMAPGIYHSPVRNAFTSSNLIVSATVTDNLMLHEVKLFYRTTGTDTWRSTSMTNHNDRWSAIIPSDALSTEGLEYYIRAYDGINYSFSGSETTPYSVTIQLAIDASAKGDVNGDGAITNIDALMLLQAANDKLNLTAEQFLRADLNDDGELSAAEALRILKYANGSISTLNG